MDDGGGDGLRTASVLLAAKGSAMTQVAKNLIHIVVSILIELKQLLESKNSPLMGCLCYLLKDYKNEISAL